MTMNQQLINQEIKELFNNELQRELFIKKQINKNYKIDNANSAIKFLTHRKSDGNSTTKVNVLFSTDTYIKNNDFKFNIIMPLDYKRKDYEKCGIEILKEIGAKKYDKNGKCVFKYYTNKELKEFCKMNKIKGYTKMSKLEIIKALRNI